MKWEDIIRLDKSRRDRDSHRRHSESDKKKHSADHNNQNKNQEGDNASEDAEKSQDAAEVPQVAADVPQESTENPEESSEAQVRDPSAEAEAKVEQNTEHEGNGAGEEEKVENKEERKEEGAAEQMDVEEAKEPEPISSHMFRVGWSLPTTGLQLGEFKHSYAYESSGKFVTEKEFRNYGITFGVGDVIGSYVVSVLKVFVLLFVIISKYL